MDDYNNCLVHDETILRSEQRFRSEAHNVLTENVNKIALCANDNKRLQIFDGITYSHGTVGVQKWKSVQHRIDRLRKNKNQVSNIKNQI